MRYRCLAFFLIGLFSPAAAQPQNVMVAPRATHTATLLFDGRVLLVGGAAGPAEIYNPTTGIFTATGSLPDGHGAHSATLLATGKVLIVGNGTADLYDPVAGTFLPTGSPRGRNHVATRLADGRVLLTGDGSVPEVYDPASGTFSPTGPHAGGPLPFLGMEGHLGAGATLLPDGRVLIASEPFAELYDPSTNTFRATASMVADIGAYGKATGFAGRAATLLDNGKVLLTGGIPVNYGTEEHFAVATAELFDPGQEKFFATGKMFWTRGLHAATRLGDGTLLVSGGTINGANIGPFEYEVYDPSGGEFRLSGSLLASRVQPQATLLNDGRVLITGGNTARAELYKPSKPVAAPALLSLAGDGRGQGAIQHAGTIRIASPDDPAVAGEYLTIYLTGLPNGTAIPPQVAIGGKLAEVTFFGNVPGFPGLNQINIRMPGGVSAGPAVSVRILHGNRTSNEVTIGAR